MLIRAGYDISFSVPAPTPLLLLLSIHPSRDPDLRSPHQMVFDPPLPHSHYMDGFGNICTRVTAQPGTLRIRNEFTIEDSGEPDILAPEAEQIPVEPPRRLGVGVWQERVVDGDVVHDRQPRQTRPHALRDS